MKKLVMFMLLVFFVGSTSVFAADVKIMDKDQLKAILDSPDTVVLDVRKGRDWSSSEFKIKGAVRFTDKDVASVAGKYDKASTFVLYCA